MVELDFEFTGKVWEYSGQGSWYFLTVPQDMSEDIKAFTKHLAKGFRTVRVSVKIGKSQWRTSLFPDKKSGTYSLPIKAAIRKAEAMKDGDTVTARLSVLI